MSTKLRFFLNKKFAFFNGRISPNFGSPCCKYGQNGKPMSSERASEIFGKLQTELPNWSLESNGKRLIKFVYISDFYQLPEIIRQIIKIDETDTRNQPSFSVNNGDLLKIELLSNSIGGLSGVDFELALKLNSVDWKHYGAVELKTDKNYRMEMRMLKNEEENKRVMDELMSNEK